jgi:hypothetical protein
MPVARAPVLRRIAPKRGDHFAHGEREREAGTGVPPERARSSIGSSGLWAARSRPRRGGERPPIFLAPCVQ